MGEHATKMPSSHLWVRNAVHARVEIGYQSKYPDEEHQRRNHRVNHTGRQDALSCPVFALSVQAASIHLTKSLLNSGKISAE